LSALKVVFLKMQINIYSRIVVRGKKRREREREKKIGILNQDLISIENIGP